MTATFSRRKILSSMLAGAAGALGAALFPVRASWAASSSTTTEWLAEAGRILRSIRQPTIPDRAVRVVLSQDLKDTEVRERIQQAIDSLGGSGGGQIIIPPGSWKVAGTINLVSNIELHISEGATLTFSNKLADYLPPVLSRWEGTEMYGFSPCIRAYLASNIALTGSGTLAGEGKSVIPSLDRQENADQALLREMGRNLTPVHERVFGEGHALRQSFIQFFGCSAVCVDGPRLRNMPFWGVHLLYSQDVTVKNIDVKSNNSNNDGIDVDSSQNVRIEHCTFRTKDDCVAVKSGRDADGRRVGRPSENIVIRECDMIDGGSSGIAVGSEMSGGVKNLYVFRCVMQRVDSALNVKSNLDRGGLVENIRMWNVGVGRCSRLLRITTNYHSYAGGNFVPVLRDIAMDDIRCERAEIAFDLIGVPATPIREVSARDVRVNYADRALRLEHAEQVMFERVVVNGKTVVVAGAAAHASLTR
jgi:polygalacturonase